MSRWIAGRSCVTLDFKDPLVVGGRRQAGACKTERAEGFSEAWVRQRREERVSHGADGPVRQLGRGDERQARRRRAFGDDRNALDEAGAKPLHEPERHAVDGGEFRAAVGDRLEACKVRSGHDDCGEERSVARDRSDRRAKEVHAAVAVPAVDRRNGAAERLEVAARIAQTADDKAAVRRAVAAGEGVFGRRDQNDVVAQILHVG